MNFLRLLEGRQELFSAAPRIRVKAGESASLFAWIEDVPFGSFGHVLGKFLTSGGLN
jgi:hypothetical protein